MTKQVELPTAITEAEVSSPPRLTKMLQLNFDAIVSFISSLEIKTDTIDSSVTDLNDNVEFIDGKEVDGENDFSQDANTFGLLGVTIRGDSFIELEAGVNARLEVHVDGITLSAADDAGVLKPVFLNGSVVELTHGVPLRIGDDVADVKNRVEFRSTAATPGVPPAGYVYFWYNAGAGVNGKVQARNGTSTQDVAVF